MPGPRFDVTTLGEMLLRRSVPPGERLENARQLNANPAGGRQVSSRCLLVWKENKLDRRVANLCSRTAGQPCLARCGSPKSVLFRMLRKDFGLTCLLS